MKLTLSKCVFIILLIHASHVCAVYEETVVCTNKKSPCYLNKISCPKQCPTRKPKDPKAKACYINCESPICKAECRRKFSHQCLFSRHIKITQDNQSKICFKIKMGFQCLTWASSYLPNSQISTYNLYILALSPCFFN